MAGNEKERDEVTYEVVEHIGILAAYPTGWKKELNRVAWNIHLLCSSPRFAVRMKRGRSA